MLQSYKFLIGIRFLDKKLFIGTQKKKKNKHTYHNKTNIFLSTFRIE